MLSIAATDANKLEGGAGTTTPFTFTVTRSGDTSGAATVNFAVAGAGKLPSDTSDFFGGTFPTGTVTFNPGVTSQVITINVVGDNPPPLETNELFSVTLSNAVGASITTATAMGTIHELTTSPTSPQSPGPSELSLAIAGTEAVKLQDNSDTTPFTVTRPGDTSGGTGDHYDVSGAPNRSATAADFGGNGFTVMLSPGTSDLPVDVLNALGTFAANNAINLDQLVTLAANIETSMYGVHGAPTSISLLTSQFLPAHAANATLNVSEALGLAFAFGNETGNTAFAADFGPSNSTMPNSAAGDAAFAAAAGSSIFGVASNPNLVNAIQGYVSNWKAFYTSNGIAGITNPTAAQIDLAARATAWGDAVGVALANNIGPLKGEALNFLDDAVHGTANYSESLPSQVNHISFHGEAANVSVQLVGVLDHVANI
jgi:hypothetical protein